MTNRVDWEKIEKHYNILSESVCMGKVEVMKKVKLLLVDDVELFLDLEKSFLNRESFEIFTARSGQEALEKIQDKMPDLVLLDLFMPEMDGDAVCREIKNNPVTRHIPVVMTTSEDTEEAKERCFSAGCDGFIPKPLKRQALLDVITEALNLSKRSYPRVPTHLSCTVIRGDDHTETWLHSIAIGGAFIEFSPPPDTGEEFELVFVLPQQDKPVRTRAVVKWQGRISSNSPQGVGVEFISISGEERGMINSYVETKARIISRLT